MPAYLSPIGNEMQLDANGNPLAGGQIWTLAAGTTSLIATYTDSAGLVPQANPIVLNSAGLPASPIWLPAGQAVKLEIKDSNGVLQRTIDNVSGINDPSNASTADQWVIFTGTPTYISATSFSLGGDQTNVFQVGRRIKSTNTGGTRNSTITASSYSAGTGLTTVTVTNDSGTLDSGLSQVSYGLISAVSTSLPGGVAFSCTQSVSQTLASATQTKITFTASEYDTTGGAYATSRYTAKVAGLHSFKAGVYITSTTTLTAYDLYIYKNGVVYKRGCTRAGLNSAAWSDSMAIDVTLAAGDYVEIFADATSGGTISTNATASVTYFQGALVRAS
jgi:hypothetical protein